MSPSVKLLSRTNLDIRANHETQITGFTVPTLSSTESPQTQVIEDSFNMTAHRKRPLDPDKIYEVPDDSEQDHVLAKREKQRSKKRKGKGNLPQQQSKHKRQKRTNPKPASSPACGPNVAKSDENVLAGFGVGLTPETVAKDTVRPKADSGTTTICIHDDSTQSDNSAALATARRRATIKKNTATEQRVVETDQATIDGATVKKRALIQQHVEHETLPATKDVNTRREAPTRQHVERMVQPSEEDTVTRKGPIVQKRLEICKRADHNDGSRLVDGKSMIEDSGYCSKGRVSVAGKALSTRISETGSPINGLRTVEDDEREVESLAEIPLHEGTPTRRIFVSEAQHDISMGAEQHKAPIEDQGQQEDLDIDNILDWRQQLAPHLRYIFDTLVADAQDLVDLLVAREVELQTLIQEYRERGQTIFNDINRRNG